MRIIMTDKLDLEILGLIPTILGEAAEATSDMNEFIDNVLAAYGFPISPMDMEFDRASLVLRHEGDPDLHPIAQYEFDLGDYIPEMKDLIVLQYNYGIICFTMPDDYVVYRLD